MSILKQILKVLIIEDNEGDLVLIKEYLNESETSFETQNCKTLATACTTLTSDYFDLIFLDLSLPDSFDNKSCIKRILAVANETPVIILTGYSDKNFAIESLHMGVQDYLMKDEMSELSLLKSCRYSIERNKILQDLKNIQKHREHEIADAVIKALEKSKTEVGIELHDNIGQLLTGVRIFVSLAQDVNHSNNNLMEADKLLMETIKELRSLSHTLTAPDFKEVSLGKVLHKFIEQNRAAANLSINAVWNNEELDIISQKLALNIYRIIQEQFNNIIKHAKAKQIELSLKKYKDQILLEIKDDGIGFNMPDIKEGIGLTNIKTRVALFNGVAQINAVPGKGCALKLSFIIDQ